MVVVFAVLLLVLLRVYQLIQTGLGYTLMVKLAKERTLEGGLKSLRIVSMVFLVPTHTLFTFALYMLLDRVIFPISNITGNGFIWAGYFFALFFVMPIVYLELKRRVVLDETRSWGIEDRPEYIKREKEIDEAIDKVLASDDRFSQ